MAEIEWPWQYNFPPFFTLQPHIETRAKQLTTWKSLVLEYFKASKLCTLDVREANELPLFNNSSINRCIDQNALIAVLNELQNSGNAVPIDKQKTRWEVYWHTLEEFGNIVLNYINNSGNLNTILTIHELTEGDDVAGEEFYQLNQDVFVKVLRLLEKNGKCAIINENEGVKFF